MRKIEFRALFMDSMGKTVWKYIGVCEVVTGMGSYIQKTNWLQYTGLDDKNGKEIYEGDIVQFKFANFKKKQIASIAYGICGFWIVRWLKVLDWHERHQVEVIGNIYENPELLEDMPF